MDRDEVAAPAGRRRAAPLSENAPAKAPGTRGRGRRVEVPLSERPIEEVWALYVREPSQTIRNFFIVKYHDIVRFTAERMHMKLPSEVDVDDLMSAGLFGLMDAIDNFDPDRGVKFETYCAQRIRGAIFDELRAMDWVPRLVRSRTAKVERIRKAMEMESGRRPTEEELCERLAVSGAEFEKLSKDSRPVGVVSLSRKCFEGDSSRDVREIDVIRDNRQENPVQVIQKQDLQTLMTRGLSRAERLILILYYYEEMTMKEIGMTLDLSESRVSQMHSSILARLKAQMQHRTKDL
jgi:RNA polymerase sigma factor for flagellar operon FliA